MTDADSQPDFSLRLGRISKPHGLQGALHFQMFRTRPQRAHDLKPRKVKVDVELEWPTGETKRHKLVSVKWQGPAQAVLRFAEVADRTQAEALIGAYLDVDPNRAHDALVDEVDRALGAEVVDINRGSLGRVVALRDNGAQALLVVDAEQELLIPYVDPIVRAMTKQDGARVVEVDLPDGLIEMNQKDA